MFISECFRCLELALDEGVEGHVGRSLVFGLRRPPRPKVLDESPDHLRRVAATVRTSIPKRAQAAMRSRRVIDLSQRLR